MKRHYQKNMLNASGVPVENVRIHVFLSDQVTQTEIENSTVSGNVFTSIDSTAYAKIGSLLSTPVNNYDSSDTISITTDSDGFFDFWISDKETSYPSYGYEYTQRFTVAWVGDGITVGSRENVELFAIHHEVDVSDNSGSTKDLENKLVSNQEMYDLNQHKDLTHTDLPHNIDTVDTTAASGESDYSTLNKLISNENAIKFDEHADNDTDDVHTQYLLVDATRGMDTDTLIANLNADKLDSQTGSYYTGYTDSHSTSATGIHGVGAGTIVGTTLTQTLTNKTLQSLTAPLDVDDGGTGSIYASGARTNLGVQAQNVNLQDIADMSGTNNHFIVGDGSGFTSQPPSAVQTILNYGTAVDYDTTDFVQTAAPSALRPQQMKGGLKLKTDSASFITMLESGEVGEIIIYNNESPMVEIQGSTGSVELSGGIGLFGVEPPGSQQTVTDLSAFVNVTSGSDQITLSDLNTKLNAVHTKLQAVLDALQAYGIV